MKRILFIINPISGIGRQKVIEKYAEAILDKTICSFSFTYTERRLHAGEIAKKEAVNFDIIVAVGGDGTVNEIASGIIGTQCSMAIIPTGSGNGLARCLGIPLDTKKAIKLIQTGFTRKIDILTCNDKYFVNVGGIGFDAEVGHLFDTASKRGIFSYLKITLSELLYFKPQRFKIEVNGSINTVEALLVSIANSTQWGNEVKIAPKAKLDDGLFDITVLKKFPFFVSPIIGIRMLAGTILNSKYVSSYQVNSALISKDEHLMKYHLDGEPLIAECNSLRISISPLKLSIVVK